MAIDDYTKLLEKLSPEKRKLFEKKLAAKKKSQNAFPLSFAQQRLWLLYQLEPESTAYHIPAAIRMKGRLHTRALQLSVAAMIERHEVLRTQFSIQDDKPVQIVMPKGSIDLQVLDMFGENKDEFEDKVAERIKLENARPFDLASGSLLRMRLYRRTDNEAVLFVLMHHIISDGWSINIFIRELTQMYNSYARGEEPSLPELPIQYVDFSAWQRKRLQGERLEEQLAYWLQKLEALPPVLELPIDHPRPAVKRFRGAHQGRLFSKQLADHLLQLATDQGVTPFILLLTALDVFLARLCNQDDVAVGVPIANRTKKEMQGLIGFFVNTLVMRAIIERGTSFLELLQQVKQTAVEAYGHQDVPFESLVEELQPQRDMSHTPLFQVMFTYQEGAIEPVALEGVTIEPLTFDSGATKFDLTFGASMTPDGLAMSIEYDVDLFNGDSVSRMLDRIGVLLDGIAANPEAPVNLLPLLPAEEEQRIIQASRGKKKLFASDDVMHQRFERMATAHPDATALTFVDEQISYGRLNKRANRLAHHLIEKGVGPDVLVGIYLERSVDIIVALLAIVKAGGAYLPIDTVYPEERIAFMLSDAEAPILLTHSSLHEKLPPHSAQTVCLDRDADQWQQRPASNPNVAVKPENLIYVIYTSGSTGKPKGAQLTHRNVVRLMDATDDWFHFNAQDVWTLFHSFAFDFSVWEVWGALAYGGRLVIVPYYVSRSPEQFYALLADEGVTVLNQTPSAFRQLVGAEEAADEKKALALRYVIFGGEALEPSSLAPWFERHGEEKPRLINMYGITETTVHVTYRPITWADVKNGKGSVIGEPIPDLELYILDREMQPAPIGVAGEICIGGEGLGRGYLKRPELSATKFVANPFSTDAGARLYRSGDLARFLADGDIEYLGRIDSQVKIRGFRIELGEVETLLNQHPAVREAIVIVHGKSEMERRIVGYVVPQTDDGVGAAELKEHLRSSLPEYMLPSAYVFLEQFPLTANGKLNRRALPAPDFGAAQQEFVEPQTPTEEALCRIFARVLKIDKISATANFFDLGGHSLLATQALSHIRRDMEIDLPLRQIFETPAVADLAAAIDAKVIGSELDAPPIVKTDGKKPLSFAQQRMWFLDQLEPGSAQYHIPSAVRMSGPLDVSVLQACLNEIVRRHEVLRTSFVTVDGAPEIMALGELDVPLPIVDLRPLKQEEKEQQVQQRIKEFALLPFDLAMAPLFRVELLQLNEDEFVFELVMHHIISDGWSSGILIREISVLYETMRRHEPAPLPELEIQYSDFAAWQRKWLQGENLEKQLDYWKKTLGDSDFDLGLPTDRPRPAFQGMNGGKLTFQLDDNLFVKTAEISRRENVTPFMVLLAAFQLLLARYANKEDVSVGTPIANRNRAETENLIGFFVNTLVLRTDLSGAPTFVELLRRVKKVTLDAYAHQDVPFDRVVDALQPQRDTSRSALFQVMFMMQNLPEQKIDLADIRLSQLNIETDISNFDITFSLEEHDGRLFGAVEYNTDLFNRATMDRMVRHYENLLAALLEQPQLTTSGFPLASGEEERLLLDRWSGEEQVFGKTLLIHKLFEKQVEKAPNAVAVRFGEKQLTYKELNARANQAAHYLRQKGVGSDGIVGLCFERSLEMIVALLGVLKSGAAYLPLDPNYPRERIEFMLHDTLAKILLTQQSLADVLPAEGVEIVAIDSQWDDIAGQSTRNPDIEAAPQNLAYVIYTSGSTGTPKGVLVTHKGVVNHNNVIRTNFHYTPADRALQFFSLNFDGAVEEIFPTLMSGATLVLRPNNVVMSVDELLELAEKEQLTVLDIPTAYWHELAFELDHYKKTLPESVRLVITGGEAASPERYAIWKKQVGDTVQWLNTYGPTEGTVIATIYDPAANPQHDMLTMPIGKPLPNDKIYILDKNLNTAPIGVPGELCIGGVGVARGYLNRPDLTAEKFIPDPFSGVEGARLYRTGDLARWREDGNVDFIGRVDDQVKIRGFRVEPGEIEAALRSHPAVRDAAVAVRTDDGRDKKLAAYYTTESNSELSVSDLRDFLKENLPAYMIPHAFMHLEILPKMISGKVDRKALPKVEYSESVAEGSGEAENETEEKLVDIVQEILGRQGVGVNDNFFELGGDSIMSIQVIARANQAGVKLTPRQLFENPTVRGLAAVAGTGEAVIAEQGMATGPVPLTPIMHWFFEQNFSDAHHWNQSLLFRIDQMLDADALQLAFARIVEQHDALRLQFSRQDGVWTAAHNNVDGVDLVQVFDFSRADAAEQGRLVEEKCAALQQHLDPENGRLVVVAYFDLGKTSRLFIAIHHLAVDGVSWRILLQDIQTAYEQAAAGQEIKLPPKTTSFKYWAEKLADYAASATVAEEAPYWTHYERQLVAPLPVDYAESLAMNDEQSMQNVAASLSKEETTKLLQELPSNLDARINDILLTALVQSFNKWTNKSSLLIDMEGHGRENLFDDVDISRTVGWFTSLYPLLLKLDRGVSGKAAVLAIKNQLQNLPKNGIGYGLLRYFSRDEALRRKLTNLPQPQMSFNYLGRFEQTMDVASSFKPAGEAKGNERSARAQRSNLIDVTAIVNNGQMHISFSYSKNIYKRETIQGVLHAFVDVLKKMITGQLIQEEPPPAQKSMSNLNKRQMNKVLEQLNKKGKRF